MCFRMLGGRRFGPLTTAAAPLVAGRIVPGTCAQLAAFLSAVSHINLRNDLLPDHKLVPSIFELSLASPYNATLEASNRTYTYNQIII